MSQTSHKGTLFQHRRLRPPAVQQLLQIREMILANILQSNCRRLTDPPPGIVHCPFKHLLNQAAPKGVRKGIMDSTSLYSTKRQIFTGIFRPFRQQNPCRVRYFRSRIPAGEPGCQLQIGPRSGQAAAELQVFLQQRPVLPVMGPLL
ncbi:hypothetical protein D3C80_1762410 [compost metagenome]